MSEANLRSMPLADRGSRGNEVPLASNRFRVSGIVSLWLTKDLLALTGAFEKLLGLMKEKIGSEGDLFFTKFVPVAFKNSCPIFSTRPCVGREKIQAEKFESWLGFQSVRQGLTLLNKPTQ